MLVKWSLAFKCQKNVLKGFALHFAGLNYKFMLQWNIHFMWRACMNVAQIINFLYDSFLIFSYHGIICAGAGQGVWHFIVQLSVKCRLRTLDSLNGYSTEANQSVI